MEKQYLYKQSLKTALDLKSLPIRHFWYSVLNDRPTVDQKQSNILDGVKNGDPIRRVHPQEADIDGFCGQNHDSIHQRQPTTEDAIQSIKSKKYHGQNFHTRKKFLVSEQLNQSLHTNSINRTTRQSTQFRSQWREFPGHWKWNENNEDWRRKKAKGRPARESMKEMDSKKWSLSKVQNQRMYIIPSCFSAWYILICKLKQC